jgi:hypothetical protein
VNRHAAIIKYPTSDCGNQLVDIRHSYITFKEIQLHGNGRSFDASRVFGDGFANDQPRYINNVIFEDNYIHDSAHLLIWCGMTIAPIEIRHNTFDKSGVTDEMGEAVYLGSSKGQRPGYCHIHHNIYGRYKANCVDFKGESRNNQFFNNLCIDHEIWPPGQTPDSDNASGAVKKKGSAGDGTFVIGQGKSDPGGSFPNTNNLVQNNIIVRPKSGTIFAGVDPVQVKFIGNVIVDYIGPVGVNTGQTKRLNGGADMYSASTSHSNIHCPSQGVQAGTDTSGSQPNNQINRPIDECDDRIDEIVGVPEMASCNIGNLNDNTIVLNINTEVHGPVSSVGRLNVTYNGTNQTGEVTTQPSGNVVHIAVTTPPANDDVVVRVVAAEGQIKNSAFLGGLTCGNRDNYKSGSYTRGQGFCGENVADEILCTNTTSGEGPPPLVEE